MNIYVASSWRNQHQPTIVKILRSVGHEVYDFRNPAPGVKGFAWADIDPAWESWTPEQFRKALRHPIALEGYKRDAEAMAAADVCVMVMPCGRSAHLEAGFFVGEPRKHLIILLDEKPAEPELMYNMAGALCTDMDEVLEALRDFEEHQRSVMDWT